MHYVVADVHGCLDELFKLMSIIDSRDKEAKYIFVGDFIDRGPSVGRTVKWMAENITPNGKYQSVLGNHEDNVIGWASDYSLCHVDTGYKYLKNMKDAGIKNPFDYVDFFKTLPLYKFVTVNGKKHFISHGVHPSNQLINNLELHGLNKLSSKARKELLWGRSQFTEGDYVYIHGHTPTFLYDEIYRKNMNVAPGFVYKTSHEVNVDCGCCFSPFYYLPLRLAAYCLETEKTIYSYSVEECFDNMYYRYGKDKYTIYQEYQKYKNKYLTQKDILNDENNDDDGEKEIILLE